MTLEEIRKELEKDFPILFRKVCYVTKDWNKRLSKAEKEKGFERFYEYCSKYKNQWIYRIHITKNDSDCTATMLYYNGKGHAAITMTRTTEFIYHTGHFFERYNERRNLGLKTINDVIRAYMRENNRYDFKSVETVAPNIEKIFCSINSGILLGMINKNVKVVKANTFIPNEMLSKNQSELKLQIINELEKYKDTSGILN
jgi:hypothetical protein